MSTLADLITIYGWFCALAVLIALAAVFSLAVYDWIGDQRVKRRDRQCSEHATAETALIDQLEQLWRI